jgi:hypothetical protein
VGISLLARGGRELYEQKLLKYKVLVAVSAIWAHADAQAAGSVWVHGLERNVSSGHYFFGSVSPIKTDATFFAQNAETGFCRFSL